MNGQHSAISFGTILGSGHNVSGHVAELSFLFLFLSGAGRNAREESTLAD
jgi:hypothetical protein